MKKRIFIELGFAFFLFMISISFLAAVEYSNEVSSDFIINSEKVNLVKTTESPYNSNYLIGILIILVLAIAVLFFKKKKSKKNMTKR